MARLAQTWEELILSASRRRVPAKTLASVMSVSSTIMSIERTKNNEWRVRWRASGRNRSKVTGPRKADAIAFEAEVKRAKRIGSIAPDELGPPKVSDFGAKFDDRHISRKA